MRYNIFVDRVLADKDDPSLVHLGELHLYFDLIPKFRTPYYVNNSFYSNPSDAEKELDSDAIQRMRKLFDSLRKSQTVFQLKFPIRGYLFHKTDSIYEKFNERQNEMMEEARAVYRKGIIRQRPKTGRPPIERTNTRASTRPPMSRSQQDFSQSSRHFQPMDRQMPRRDRKPNERGQGLPPKAQNEPEFDEMQRNFGQNNRDFNRRRRKSGSFSGNNRKSFNSKTNFNEGNRRKPIDNIESDVMFEDTREKHERSGGKPSGKSRRGGINRIENRVGDKHINAFRDRRDSDTKERSEFRQQNRDVLREDFASHQIPSVFASNTTSGPFYSGSIQM